WSSDVCSSDLNDLYLKAVANGFSNFGLRQKGFNSHYDGFQATVKHEASHGFAMLTSYTWSHAFAEASNFDALENVVTDVTAAGTIARKLWSQADFDVRHRLTVSGSYELPFGRSKEFRSEERRVGKGGRTRGGK